MYVHVVVYVLLQYTAHVLSLQHSICECCLLDPRSSHDLSVLQKIVRLYSYLKDLRIRFPLKDLDIKDIIKKVDVVLSNFMSSEHMSNDKNLLKLIQPRSPTFYENELVRKSMILQSGPLAVCLDVRILVFCIVLAYASINLYCIASFVLTLFVCINA